jgi:hypothetical protein
MRCGGGGLPARYSGSESRIKEVFTMKHTMTKEKKTATRDVTLKKGFITIYDYGAIKLHAYQTNDPMNDQVFLLEKGDQLVAIEEPCFKDNIRELMTYVAGLDATNLSRVLAYHTASDTFLPDSPVYSTVKAVTYGSSGPGKAMVQNFVGTFGDDFEPSISTASDYISPGAVTIGGIRFGVIETEEAFDLEIPEINALYTHMLGHDVHSIVASEEAADVVLYRLESYYDKGFDLLLSSHHAPETPEDLLEKIDYLKTLKRIASVSASGETFKASMQTAFPHYSGDNYLDMTTGMLFPK